MNINDQVSVRLTADGASVYNAYQQTLLAVHRIHLPAPKKLAEGDLLREQLWELMNIFGGKIYVGSNPLFIDNEIRSN